MYKVKNIFISIPITGTFIKSEMAKNTSVLLGEYFEEFIADEISSGRYNSASEVIRNALRLLKAEERKKKDLNKTLVLGEKDGFIKKLIYVNISENCTKKFC